MVEDNHSNVCSVINIDSLTTAHSRQKPDPEQLSVTSTAATVLTGHCSSSSVPTEWTTIGQERPVGVRYAASASTRHPVAYDNYYSGLDFDADCIAIDSGASEGFGDVDTPGTNRTPVAHGITMVSATLH